MAKKPTLPTPITAHIHADSRANIPTEELRDFIADDERNPKTMLYPRDPSLDPQLVWKGKDEQDQADLAVPAVPIYIQEHIKPQAIVELVKAEAKNAGAQPQQMGLFADFNGLDFAERVDFYHHEQHWTNRMILGDSLLVMTSLAEKEGLKGKVQMIYFDPPYGIKFGSNWQVSTRKRDVKDGKAEDATRQPEQVKAFRDTWQLGIHSYLSYLRDRLVTARELLTESGSIFVQIGDENVHLAVAIALARTRLMAGRYPYYLLLDHEKHQPRLEDLRAKINAARSPLPQGDGSGVRDWQEWEIPRTVKSGKSEALSVLLAEYWQARRERQKEIDASIARRAEVEMLYDQPYEDPKRIRVAGPFTVESLSPHRVLSTDEAEKEKNRQESAQSADFVAMILENLKAAGVQNTFKKERLKFTRLDPYPGTWLHAVGEYTEKDGAARRVAVSIGPELGTLGADQVKEAAKEAVQGVGFDLLIVCGFAFDPHVSEEAKRYGRLTVLPTRINPDLAMGGDLLKRTGAGNLFMVFGEPDVEIRPCLPSPSKGWMSTTRPPAKSAPTKRTTSPAGSLIPTTAAKASSSATPTSPAPTNPTKNSNAPCGPKLTKPPGARCIKPPRIPLKSPRAAKSP